MTRADELSLTYKKLVLDVITELIRLINKSKIKSKNNDCKVIKVNVFDYTELGLFDNKLTFFDKDGLHYSLFCDCEIEDLIDILITKY